MRDSGWCHARVRSHEIERGDLLVQEASSLANFVSQGLSVCGVHATRLSHSTMGGLLVDRSMYSIEVSKIATVLVDDDQRSYRGKLASSPGPSQRGEKGLVHTDCACANLYPKSGYIVYSRKIFSKLSI